MPPRLALIAGSGALVPEAIRAAREKGWDVALFDVAGRADLAGENVTRLSFADTRQMVATLRASGASHVCAVGAIELSDAQRRSLIQFVGLVNGIGGIADRILTATFAAAARGRGIRIIGVDELLPQLVAPEGHFAGPADKVPPAARCAAALRAARAVGTLDMGQAAVLSGDRIIAAEGIERTDGLIARVAGYVASGLVDATAGNLILAKCLKPRQPRYLDMPAIGPDTVTGCAGAGIAAIVVEAGGTLLIERARLEALASERGVAIVGRKAKD